MKEENKVQPIKKVEYEIIKNYSDNPSVRTILYTEKLYKFMMSQELSLLPIKIINVILSAVKQEQQNFINPKETVVENKQLSFDDLFQNWNENTRAEFTLSFKSIKLNKDIKNRDLFNSFIILSNIHWEIFDDEKTGICELIPFIEGVKWTSNKNQRDRHIQFRMHRKIMERLLDMSKFLKLEADFVMNLKSPKTLSFIFWVSKFIPHGGTTIGVAKFCEEMNIKYSYISKVDEYLKRIRAEINSTPFYVYGMNYSFKEDLLKMQIFEKKEAIGKVANIDTLEDLQIKRAIYHIVKKRGLNKHQKQEVEKIYKYTGYQVISKLIKRKVDNNLMGDEYIQRLGDIISGKV
jgi:hypothetical protein